MNKFLRILICLSVLGILLLIPVAFWYKIDPGSLKSFVKSNAAMKTVAEKALWRWREWRHPLREVKLRRQKEEPREVFLEINSKKTIGTLKPFWSGEGLDQFYANFSEPGLKRFYKHVAEINKKRKVVRYWRSHNIFSDRETPWGILSGGKVYTEDSKGRPLYDWTRVDRVFDTVVNAGVIPIVEFGFMPEALTSDPERSGDWGQANVAPPKDYKKWKMLVREAVLHLKERYGEQILDWYFEVWNEPDLHYFFWIESKKRPHYSDVDEYNKLYDYTVQGLIEADPRLKVGGPAIAGRLDVWEEFLNHVENGTNYATGGRGSRIDFLSFHKYGNLYDHVLSGSMALIDKAMSINQERFEKLPVLIDEYGPTTSSTGNWRNTPYVAAWITAMIDGYLWISDNYDHRYLPDVMVFWAGIGKNYSEGGGVLGTTVENEETRVFVRGPVLNVFDLLSNMGTERLEVLGREFGDKVSAFATKKDNGEIAVLVYRFNAQEPEQDDFVSVSLGLTEMKGGTYLVKHFRIDSNYTNPYQLYVKRGGYRNLSLAGFRELENKTCLEEFSQPEQLTLSDSYYTDFQMPKNAVSLIILTPLEGTMLTSDKSQLGKQN